MSLFTSGALWLLGEPEEDEGEMDRNQRFVLHGAD